MKSTLFIIISLSLFTSCDYAKQQKELTQLKLENIELSKKVKRYKLDSLFKSSEIEKDPHKLKALRIIDSLKFNDPNTFKHIQIEIQNSDYHFE